MNILGLIEMRPFDGSPAFVCLRIDNNGHLFDLPIDQSQLQIILQNQSTTQNNQYEEESFEEEVEEGVDTFLNASEPLFNPSVQEEDPIRLNKITMGQPMEDYDSWEDDAL